MSVTERLANEGELDMREKQWDFAPAGATARLTVGGGGLWPETQEGSEHMKQNGGCVVEEQNGAENTQPC